MPANHPDTRSDADPSGETAPAGGAEAPDELAGLDFEAAVEELEALVAQMETGELTLEASLAAYERGVKLTRHCQAALRNAELKIKKLTEDDRLEPLDPDAFDDD